MFPAGVPLSKRLFDLILTSLGLLIISPIFIILGIMVWIFNGRPIVFRQVRPGYRNQPFSILKFRSMNQARDEEGQLLPDEQRITPIGKILRLTSLDELPELINVLRGEMSLVGPRPLLMQYLELYSDEQSRRHDVLPGITGWAQINGRNLLTWDDKFIYDIWYVDNWSLWLDIKILIITLWKWISREGINQPGHATAEEFKGSDDKNETSH